MLRLCIQQQKHQQHVCRSSRELKKSQKGLYFSLRMVVYTATEIDSNRQRILTFDSLARKIGSGSCNRRRWMLL